MALGALGKRETDDGVGDLREEECAPVKRQAVGVMVKSIVIAVVATAIVVAL